MTTASPARLRALWLLAALVLVLRAAIPAGWMPEVHADGIRIALCSGSGPIELVLGADGTYHREAPATPAAHDPCPFGLATAQPMGLAPTIAVEPPVYAAEPARAVPGLDPAPSPSRRALRPPTRGPPLLA